MRRVYGRLHPKGVGERENRERLRKRWRLSWAIG
jgi:hypothetical protein